MPAGLAEPQPASLELSAVSWCIGLSNSSPIAEGFNHSVFSPLLLLWSREDNLTFLWACQQLLERTCSLPKESLKVWKDGLVNRKFCWTSMRT